VTLRLAPEEQRPQLHLCSSSQVSQNIFWNPVLFVSSDNIWNSEPYSTAVFERVCLKSRVFSAKGHNKGIHFVLTCDEGNNKRLPKCYKSVGGGGTWMMWNVQNISHKAWYAPTSKIFNHNSEYLVWQIHKPSWMVLRSASVNTQLHVTSCYWLAGRVDKFLFSFINNNKYL
jgi:hypothetical protein